MIISRTPFRVSFVGGGTDLESYCEKETGCVLSTSINKYIYVTVKRQVAIASHKYRISWNKLELVNSVEEIDHPIIREALKMYNFDFPLEITTFADVPSQTGLGSSSSFAVGLVSVLSALNNEHLTKYELVQKAADIEIRKIGRTIGTQDHVAASYGGINVIKFFPNLELEVCPVFYDPMILNNLENNLFLFYTEMKRDAGEILAKQSRETDSKFEILTKMKSLVEPLRKTLTGEAPLDEFGTILHENWLLKKQITPEISNSIIDNCYERAIKAGAIGGKLLGAGGGGFILFYIRPEDQINVINELKDFYCMPFSFDIAGTRITYYDQSNITISDRYSRKFFIDTVQAPDLRRTNK